MGRDIFSVFLDSVCLYFIDYFCINVQNIKWSEFHIHVESLCFRYQLTIASENEDGNIPSLSVHWNRLKSVGINSFFKLVELGTKFIWPCPVCIGSLLMTVTISLGIIGLLSSFSRSRLNLGNWYLSRTLFHLYFPD